MKYEIQRFIEDKFRSGEGTKKIVLISLCSVLFLVAAVLIGRTLFSGGPSVSDRQPGIAEQSPEIIERVEKEGYVGGSHRVAPSDG